MRRDSNPHPRRETFYRRPPPTVSDLACMKMADRVRFELTVLFQVTLGFKPRGINHSPICPFKLAEQTGVEPACAGITDTD